MAQAHLRPVHRGDQLEILIEHDDGKGYTVGQVHKGDVPTLAAALLDWVNHGQYSTGPGETRVTQHDPAEPGLLMRSASHDYESPIGTTERPPSPPHLGDPVLYRSRTGDYWLAGVVARTVHSSSPEALDRARTNQGRMFLVPLGLRDVDLVVFSSGGAPGTQEQSATGTYVEHNISYDPDGRPGTWCWPEDVGRRGELP